MSDSGSDDDEIDGDLRVALEKTREKLYNLREEKDRKIAELEYQISKANADSEKFWQQRIIEVNQQNQETIRLLTEELAKLRDAFSGDSSGWEERITPGGMVVYENKVTGESRYDEPEILAMAKVIRKADQADEMSKEISELKIRLKDLEMRKREGDLSVNKLKAEVNQLRKAEKAWKDSSKTIAINLLSVKNAFDMQCDQVINGLDLMSKVDARIHRSVPTLKVIRNSLRDLQVKSDSQQSQIIALTSNIRILQLDIHDKQKRIEQLSYGLGDELERLMKPMRDRLAESMVTVMKEKADRAQERRELADLWPSDHLMPTVLMQYRSLSDDEKHRRIELARANNAKLALAIDIRSKVAESKLWDMKYDDYGRLYYEHSKTGEVQWEEPEIRRYSPPPGYDTSGNIIESYHETMEKWRTLSHANGEIYFQHIETDEITYSPPYAYSKEPKGKSYEELVGEAAQLVLGYIKNKISTHISNMKQLAHDDINSLTAEERRILEKEEKIKARLGLRRQDSSAASNQSNNSPKQITTQNSFDVENMTPNRMNSPSQTNSREQTIEDLSVYQYDIETVEMLSWRLDERYTRLRGKDLETYRQDKRKYLEESKARDYSLDSYTGPTLHETDVNKLSTQQLRAVIEYYASMEEKMDKKLLKIRGNMKEFSYVLMDRLKSIDNESITSESNKSASNVVENVIVNPTQSSESPRKTAPKSPIKQNVSFSDTDRIIDSTSSQKVSVDTPSMANIDVDNEDYDPVSVDIDACYVKTYGGHLYSSSNEIDHTVDMISKDSIKLCNQLVNFTLYCGYTNTNIDDLPSSCYDTSDVDAINESNNQSDESNPNHRIYNKIKKKVETDDEWLSASFFFAMNKQNVDMIRKELSGEFRRYLGQLKSQRYSSFDESNTNKPTDLAIEAKDSVDGDESYEETSPNTDDPLRSLEYADLVDIFGRRGTQNYLDNKQRPASKSWLPSIESLQNRYRINHDVWKSRQFMATILRYQLQQRAIQLAYDSRLSNDNIDQKLIQKPLLDSIQHLGSFSSNPIQSNHRDRPVILTITFMSLSRMQWSHWIKDQSYYIQISLGNWKSRTCSKPNLLGDTIVSWGKELSRDTMSINKLFKTSVKYATDDLSVQIEVPVSRLDCELLYFEVFRQSNYTADDLIGSVALSVHHGIDAIGMIIKNDLELINQSHDCHYTGQLQVNYLIQETLSHRHRIDPRNILNTYEPRPYHRDDIREINLNPSSPTLSNAVISYSDPLHCQYPKLSQDKLCFASLFDDYATTDGKLMNLITKEITADEILEKGYRISPIESIRPLPNFHRAKFYLKTKSKITTNEINESEQKIQHQYQSIEDLMDSKLSRTQRYSNDVNKRLQKYQDLLTKIETDIKRIKELLITMKIENIRPKELVIEEILPAVLVPSIPNLATAREDKTRPILSASQMTDIIKAINTGDMDGKDWFEIFSSYRANPNQLKLLTKEIQLRNEYLESKRNQDIVKQTQIIDHYNEELLNYEKLEKKRKLELNRLKKESRKIYLKYDLIQEIIQQIQEEYDMIELDLKNVKEFNDLYQQMKNQYQLMKMKCVLEKERHTRAVKGLKKRLYQLMNNRKQILLYPSTMSQSLDVLGADDETHRRSKRYPQENRQSNLGQKNEGFMNSQNQSRSSSSSSFNQSSNQMTRQSTMKTNEPVNSFDQKWNYQVSQLYHESIRSLKTLSTESNMYFDVSNVELMNLNIYERTEEILESMEYELIDIKQSIYQEGIYLHSIHQDELTYTSNEYHRLLIIKETLQQRLAIDQIIQRNQYEILNLYDSKEKILILEAERDDVGLDTINNDGEQYSKKKQFDSNEIKVCNRSIELVRNKIQLTYQMNSTATHCQINIYNALNMQYQSNMNGVSWKDTWIEQSDYQRSQQLLSDMVQWLIKQRQALKEYEKSLTYERNELEFSIMSYEKQGIHQQKNYEGEIESISQNSIRTIQSLQNQLQINQNEAYQKQLLLEETIKDLSTECQRVREQLSTQTMLFEDKNKILSAMVTTQQDTIQHVTAKLETVIDDREKISIKSKLDLDRLKTQLRSERKYSSYLLFMITSLKGRIAYDQKLMKDIVAKAKQREIVLKQEKSKLHAQNYNCIYAISQLAISPNDLFEFFTLRLANLCGSGAHINKLLAQDNNAIMVLSALCRSPRSLIRKYASRALGNIGWDSQIERKILVWDAMMYWKKFQSKILEQKDNSSDYQDGLNMYVGSMPNTDRQASGIIAPRESINDPSTLSRVKDSSKDTTIKGIQSQVNDILLSRSAQIDEDFRRESGLSSANASVRTIIKYRRQYALRLSRRLEGPNLSNQRLINIKDGIIPSLIEICQRDGENDAEIPRNAALALCIASYETMNHSEMSHDRRCIDILVKLCKHDDPEVQTHAAITIANLCHNDEYAQLIFGGIDPSVNDAVYQDLNKLIDSTVSVENSKSSTNIIPTLLRICNESSITDLLEASTAALSNISCYCDRNCKTILDLDGVAILIRLIKSTKTENLLDLDQNDEIQANAAEVLANISRYHTEESIFFFDKEVIDSLVYMCASRNQQLKRHAPLVMGNIAQSEACREELGFRGGIEALFLALEDIPLELPTHLQPAVTEATLLNKTNVNLQSKKELMSHAINYKWKPDPIVQANVLWALCNLMWHPLNQERAGRFLHEIIGLLTTHSQSTSSEYHPVRIYANTLLANVLYYHQNNRVKFLEYEGSLEILMSQIDPNMMHGHPFTIQNNNNSSSRPTSREQMNSDDQSSSISVKPIYDLSIVENSLRSLLSLSYVDYVSHWLVIVKGYMGLLLQYLKPPYLSKDVVRFTLGVVSNLTISYEHRRVLFASGGLDILINLHLDDDKSIISLSQEVVDRLEDVSAPEEFAKSKANIGLKNMIGLTAHNDPLVRSVAAESIGEEIWMDKSKQKQALDEGGMDALLRILSTPNEQMESVLPSLWSLRNLLNYNSEGQHQFFMKDGINILVPIIQRCAMNSYEDQVEKVLEACLACISTAIINHTGNSRRLLVVGLKTIMDIIDGKYLNQYMKEGIAETFTNNIVNAFKCETVIALSKTILIMLGPYNYIVCRNCGKKQDLSGTNCSFCGHRLRVDIADMDSPIKKRHKHRSDSPIKEDLLKPTTLQTSLSATMDSNMRSNESKVKRAFKTSQAKSSTIHMPFER